MILIFGDKYDVIVLGSLSIDNFITVDSIKNQLKPGNKILIDKYITETGGGGGNAAATLANFGLKVKLISKIGDDENSNFLKNNLRSKKITLEGIKSKKYDTAFSLIIVGKKDNDRIALSHKGASDHLGLSDFSMKKINSSWLYLGTMLGESFKTAEKVAEHAFKKRIKILFNPSTYLASKGKKRLYKILKYTTILVLNKEEAALVVGKKMNVKKLLLELSNLGPEIVVITDGPNKINVIDGKCTYSLKPYKVNIVSTLGAGDAFSSALLSSYILNNNIDTSLKIAAANAAHVLQNYGATVGIINYDKATKFIKKRDIKIEERCEIKW